MNKINILTLISFVLLTIWVHAVAISPEMIGIATLVVLCAYSLVLVWYGMCGTRTKRAGELSKGAIEDAKKDVEIKRLQGTISGKDVCIAELRDEIKKLHLERKTYMDIVNNLGTGPEYDRNVYQKMIDEVHVEIDKKVKQQIRDMESRWPKPKMKST